MENLRDVFFDRVEKTESCWMWNGYKTPLGYGMIREDYAHRVAYKMFVGDIPEDCEIDHLCRNRSCVNPDHLEAVDHRTNLLRSSLTLASKNASKTHCSRGHEYSEENIYRFASGYRKCKMCQRIRDKKRYWGKRETIMIGAVSRGTTETERRRAHRVTQSN